MRRVYQQSAPYMARPAFKYYKIDAFKGADFSHNPTDVDIARSPFTLNMVRYSSTATVGDDTTQGDASMDIGAIRKRMGFAQHGSFSDDQGNAQAIGMGFTFDGQNFVVAGGKVHYLDGQWWTEVGGVATSFSVSSGWRIKGRNADGADKEEAYYIADGAHFRQLYKNGSGYAIRMLSTSAGDGIVYVPTVLIGTLPAGGGTVYEGYNLIGRRYTVSYYVAPGTADADKTEFILPNKNMTNYVSVKVMTSAGTWSVKTEGTDFNYDSANGKVTFLAGHIPPDSYVTGMDNVKITVALGNTQFSPMAEKIDKCTVGILYGVNGLTDRLFLSGNPDHPNYEWYSAQDDPTYFPDLNYSVLGEDGSSIVGYSIINDRLVAHKSASVDGRNAVVQYGQMIDGKAEFPVVTMLRGEGAVSPKGFAFLRTEPLFVTSRGISAITSSDVLGEKYSQIRSSYINGRLLRAPEGLSGARAIVYKDLYLLFVGRRVYVLDGLQKAYAKEEPYSSHQYEGYYWFLNLASGENVTAVWEYNQQLWFGTSSGKVYAFYTNPDDPASYNDNGEPIAAIWDTPYLTGNVTYNRKTFRYLGVTMQAYPATSLTVYAMERGDWIKQWEDGSTPRYFAISDSEAASSPVKYIDFENFSFSTDTTQITVHHAVNVKFVDKTMFRFRNGELNQPFVLYDAVIEYQETGKM